MNTNEAFPIYRMEKKPTLAEITQQMDQTIKELHKMHNMIKGARLFRDAVIKEHRNMTKELYDIFELVVRPLEEAFDNASKKHTELFDLSMGAK